RRNKFPTPGNRRRGAGEETQIACVAGRAVKTRYRSLQITDLREVLAEGAQQQRVFEQAGNGLLSRVDLVKISEGMQHPIPEQTRAHRSDCAIERGKQSPGFSATGLDNFEMTLRRGVEDQELA